MARRRRKHRNPDPVTTLALIVAGGALVVGGVYVYRRHRQTIGTLYPTRPVRPSGPTGPAGPTEPTTNVIESFTTPYSTVKLSHDSGYTQEPYRVWVTIPSQTVSHESGFADEDAARLYVNLVLWYFGKPLAEDDIFITATSVYIDPYQEKRGAVWQSVTDGRFYYTFAAPGQTGAINPWYPSSDQAMTALQQHLDKIT